MPLNPIRSDAKSGIEGGNRVQRNHSVSSLSGRCCQCRAATGVWSPAAVLPGLKTRREHWNDTLSPFCASVPNIQQLLTHSYLAMTNPSSLESRRSTRVPLKVVISVEDDSSQACDGETEIVNLHGALIHTAIELPYGARVSIHVYLTDKCAKGRVVYINLFDRLLCGIALDRPENIWGVPLPPKDWTESAASRAKH
jgi:hypothetical protein